MEEITFRIFKQDLLDYVFDRGMKHSNYRKQLHDKILYVTCEQSFSRLTEDKWEEVAELQSTQEEADTRLLLYTQHVANNGYKAAIICSEDIDVLIISLGMQHKMNISIYQKFGTKTCTQYADINKIRRSHGQDICDSLIGLHAFTGCDSISRFASKGKLTTLQLLKKDPSIQAFKQSGQHWEFSNGL